MAIVETKFSQEESLRRIHDIVERINRLLRKHSSDNAFGKVTGDIQISKEDDYLKAILSKFNYANLKQFYGDAAKLGELAKTNPRLIGYIKKYLREIENLMGEMRKSGKTDIRKARFLIRTAHHLSRKVRGIEKEVDKTQNEITKHARGFSKKHANAKIKRGF